MTVQHPLAAAIDRALPDHWEVGYENDELSCACGYVLDGDDDAKSLHLAHVRAVILAEIEAEYGPITVEYDVDPHGHRPTQIRLAGDWRAEQ